MDANKIEENRSKGRKRVEKYVVFDELPKYDDLHSFEYTNNCIFCRNPEEQGENLDKTNFFTCIHCREHLIEVEEGRNSNNSFEYGDKHYILPYFMRDGDNIGWAYHIEIPFAHWDIDFGDEGNDTLFERRELALIAGIKHVLEITENYDST